jgi:hypothetical protein
MTLQEAMAELSRHAVPAEKQVGGNTIMSRPTMLRTVVPVILDDFHKGYDSILTSLYSRCLADKGFPTLSGAMKSLGDGLGQNAGGLRLHRVLCGGERHRAVKRCKANVALILERFPDDGEAIAAEAGFPGGLAELVEWANTLA